VLILLLVLRDGNVKYDESECCVDTAVGAS